MTNITIDGNEYDIDTLPPEVKGQLSALQQCDQKINSWNMDIAIAQTARAAYAAELYLLLKQVGSDGDEKMDVLEIEEVNEVDVLEDEEIEANR